MASTADLVGASAEDVRAEKGFWQMTAREKLGFVKEVITVEPLIAAYVIPPVLCAPTLYNLEFEKACRSDLGLEDRVCEAILGGGSANVTDENDAVQVVIGKMHSWQGPIQSIMPLILVLFLGSFSDRHKLRKPFLLLPIFGEFLAITGCILCVVFMKEWPLAVLGVAQTVVPSFFGGQTMIVMAVFAYIADVSTVEMRTLRVGVIQIVLNVVMPLAQAVSGVLFNEIGYYGVLSMAAVFYLLAVLYGIFCIKEPKKSEVKSKKAFLMDAFDPKHAIDTFGLLFRKSPGNNRLFLVMVLIILFFYSLVVTGEALIFPLYAQKFFAFTFLEFSYFGTANTVVHLIGTLIGVPLFTKFLHLSDLMILVATFMDKILSNIFFALANSLTTLYVAVVVSFLTGISPIAIRSLATKIVSSDDLGKAQSLFGICEAIGPAVAAPLYNALYLETTNSLPAAFFYFGAILYAACIALVIWMYMVDKAKSNKVKDETTPDVNGKSTEIVQMTHI